MNRSRCSMGDVSNQGIGQPPVGQRPYWCHPCSRFDVLPMYPVCTCTAPNNALEPTPTASARTSLRLLARLTAGVRRTGGWTLAQNGRLAEHCRAVDTAHGGSYMTARTMRRGLTRIGPCAVLATFLTYTLLITPFAAETQMATNTRRIGVFAPGSASGTDQFQQLLKAFRQGLRDLGCVEGQTVVIETRWGEGRLAEFPRLVSELVTFPVDVLVTWGPQAVSA